MTLLILCLAVLVDHGQLQLPQEGHDEVAGESPGSPGQRPGQAVAGWLVSSHPAQKVGGGGGGGLTPGQALPD